MRGRGDLAMREVSAVLRELGEVNEVLRDLGMEEIVADEVVVRVVS